MNMISHLGYILLPCWGIMALEEMLIIKGLYSVQIHDPHSNMYQKTLG